MNFLKRLLETDADSFRGKLVLLLLDKLVIGAILALAFLIYDRYRAADVKRADRDRTAETQRFQKELATLSHSLEVERAEQAARREDRAAELQQDFERVRLSKDVLPLILDDTSDTVARGYVLQSAYSAKLLNAETVIELGHKLHTQGIPKDDFRRIMNDVLPQGMHALARRGNRLLEEWIRQGESPGNIYYSPENAATNDEAQLAITKEWDAWRGVAMDASLRLEASRHDVPDLISGLYFLLQCRDSGVAKEFFTNSNRTLKLIGSIDCLRHNWGPTVEAAAFLSDDWNRLDFTTLEDVKYAQAVLDVLYLFGSSKTENGTYTANSTSEHLAPALAKLLVDETFQGRVPWLGDDAAVEDRQKWLADENAADAHSSLLFRAGELLYLMGSRAKSSEPALLKYVEQFVADVSANSDEALSRMGSQHGNKSIRHAIAVLSTIDSPKSRTALQSVAELEDKLGAFEGIRMELEAVKQRRLNGENGK